MNLHEYQAKALFADYGIPVPSGQLAATVEEALAAVETLGGERWVVKAQVHAGARGKAGGIRPVKSLDELEVAVRELIGSQLVTRQTRPEGLPVNSVWIEGMVEIERELYLGMALDRACGRIAVMASAAGGMDIEEVAATAPEQIHSATIDPVTGLQPYQCREIAFGLGLHGKQVSRFTQLLLALAALFSEKDGTLVEINPLIVTTTGDLLALDAKIVVDDSALYRQERLRAFRDLSQEEEREREAQAHGLSYITLDGNIACMVNGAGLAMATMDLIKLHGGEPANFLDVGGTATAERVTEAFKLILSDPKVEAVLVNIFGGIVRCDLIAEGIVNAVQEVGMSLPLVVRLEGTNVERGKKILHESGLTLTTADDLTAAAEEVVALAAGAKG